MKIIIYDGHPLMRDGLAQLLTERGDEVLHATSDAHHLLSAASAGAADLLLIDPVTLPATALDSLRVISARKNHLHCLVYTATENAALLLRGTHIVLQGCLSKAFSTEALHAALDGLAKGISMPLPLTALHKPLDAADKADQEMIKRLTRRELQILRQLGAGKSNKMIAHEMALSNKTISTYKRSIMLKMKTQRVVDLIAFAQRNGF